LDRVTVTRRQVRPDAYCDLELEAQPCRFLTGDEVWVEDTRERTSLALVREWSPTAAAVFVGREYRDSLVGSIGVGLRFSPATHIEGVGPLLERDGGLPNVADSPVERFACSKDQLALGVDGLEFSIQGPDVVFGAGLASADTLLALDFAMFGERIAVLVEACDHPGLGVLCRRVKARIV
jgi:hypothetical protein